MSGSGPHDEPGRLVRPFAIVTGDSGGTGAAGPPAAGLDLLSWLLAARPPDREEVLYPERAEVLRLCARPRTVAELAAHLDLPLSVVKPLLSTMVGTGALRRCAPEVPPHDDGVLYAVRDALRAL